MIQIALVIMVIIGLVHLWIVKRRNDYTAREIIRQLNKSRDMKRTMAMGLHTRFNFKRDPETGKILEKTSDLFIKQTAHEFEDFVSDVIEDYYGGEAEVTVGSGDHGVDIRHFRDDGLYLGQVKAFKEDMNYLPIALIHSNMVKENAKGGFVVTTGNFTDKARQYAQDLNIELIDGETLVNYWLIGLEDKDKELVGQPEEIKT
ncbi:restriction endonuclease [Aquibacillus sp. 3ASR75-11]|uniref:Restriction endonuclease n=1 Tax=Terrihalobacillus insolitus TaxID=2950438 RepID=A0A9X3WU06_9BACI|nr:restriction endonuclease [Terrihalobacillus insolitus]MDC3412011.1 restriction endonuclease [Terrihalobacillus insolitus]MDC3423304.1 restriction endonuclease [Terrihalobacillus insolitus]